MVAAGLELGEPYQIHAQSGRETHDNAFMRC
jgi:hypothetical protein